MTRIRTMPQAEAHQKLRWAVEAHQALCPTEYATPAQPTADGSTSGIVAAHYRITPTALP